MEGLTSILAAPSSEPSIMFLALLLPALLVLCALVPLVLQLRTSTKLKLPPGPRGLPFIGHLHLLGPNPHISLSNLTKTHGPLFFLRFGSVPVVVASTPTMARQILRAHDQTFSFRLQPAVSSQMHNCDSILFSPPGPYWKLMRQLCATDLFASQRFASFRPLITEEVHAVLRSILEEADQVPLRAKLHSATSNIISRMAVGKRLTELAPRSEQANPSSYNLVSLLMEYVCLLGAFNVGDYIPCLAWMDLQGYVRRSKAIAQKLHILWQEVIDERRERHRQSHNIAGEQHDFLDVLMAVADRRPDIPIKDLHIMAMLTDIFAAGIDTSAISTEWALAMLLSNPIKMRRLQDELECVVGMSRLVQVADIPHLPYLHAVVKETMRLHPVGPLLFPHKASQQCNIAGYDIPAGTLAFVNIWAIGRDPDVWERPLEFRPERFLECNVDVHGQHFELLPFGSGRRTCPGLILGLTNVQYMLASLVHCFDWSPTEEVNMAEKYHLVLTLERPLRAKATPRPPMHLLANPKL